MHHLWKKVHCDVSGNTIRAIFIILNLKKKSLNRSHISVAIFGSSASICEIPLYYLIKCLSLEVPYNKPGQHSPDVAQSFSNTAVSYQRLPYEMTLFFIQSVISNRQPQTGTQVV